MMPSTLHSLVATFKDFTDFAREALRSENPRHDKFYIMGSPQWLAVKDHMESLSTNHERKLTQDQIDRAVAMAREGERTRAIAHALHVPDHLVRYATIQAGAYTPAARRGRSPGISISTSGTDTSERNAAIIARYLANESITTIAKDHGISRQRVEQIYARRGVHRPRLPPSRVSDPNAPSTVAARESKERNDIRRAERRERDLYIVALREAGASWAEAASVTGVSVMTAYWAPHRLKEKKNA